MVAYVNLNRCLEYLLRNDANPGIRDKQGYNAVHYSAAYGHRLCLELVREQWMEGVTAALPGWAAEPRGFLLFGWVNTGFSVFFYIIL